MRRSLVLSSTLLFAACAAACGAPPTDAELGSISQPIVNGVVSDASDDTVVLVKNPGISNCSGTMIAPNLVATALHCVTDKELGFFTCLPDGSLAEGDEEAGLMGSVVDASDIGIISGADIQGKTPIAHGVQLLTTNSTSVCRGDIAFLVLDQDLDLPITPVRLDYGVEQGDRVDVAGYGQTEENGSSGRHSRDGLTVIDVGPSSEDDPGITAAPRTFVVDEGPCHGDSGGPAIAEDTGALVGVYSLAAGSSCTGIGVRNVYTHLSMFKNLAVRAFQAAGAEPIIDEAPPPPEAPDYVPENTCSVGSRPASGGVGSLVVLAMLGLGATLRRSRKH